MHKVKNPLIFIFITVLIDCIGIRIVFPVTASIIAEVSRVSLTEAVTYSGWLMASYAIMQFIFSPLLGSLSDQFGRRPILLLSLLGLGVDYLFLAFANTLPLLFLGRLIAGICGASLTTSFAYVADISAPEKRAQNFGLIGAAVGLGFIIGPFIGGVFSEFGTRVPFIIAACLSFINFLYGFFILPESLQKENRRAFKLSKANPISTFLEFKKNKSVRKLLIVLFLTYLATQVLPSIWPFYTKYLFNWSDLEIGYSLTFVGLMVAIVKGGLIKWTEVTFGSIRTIYIGLIFSMIGLYLFAFTNHSWMIYLFTLIYCIGGIATPSLQGMISSKIPDNEQGELQGVITSLLSLANILSPLLMTNLFYIFTNEKSNIHFPGAPFLIAGVIILIGFLIFKQEMNTKKHSLVD